MMDVRDMQVVNGYGDRFGMNEHGVAYVAVCRDGAGELLVARSILRDELQARQGEPLARSIWARPAKVGAQELGGVMYVMFEEGEDPEND